MGSHIELSEPESLADALVHPFLAVDVLVFTGLGQGPGNCRLAPQMFLIQPQNYDAHGVMIVLRHRIAKSRVATSVSECREPRSKSSPRGHGTRHIGWNGYIVSGRQGGAH